MLQSNHDHRADMQQTICTGHADTAIQKAPESKDPETVRTKKTTVTAQKTRKEKSLVRAAHQHEKERTPTAMTYETFKKEIRTRFLKDYPEAVITITANLKNNDEHRDVLTIRESGVNICPVLCLNDYYEDLADQSLDEIYARMNDAYQKNRQRTNLDLSFFMDFSRVKDRIIFSLVSTSRNRELLEDVPHIDYLDLSIVFRYLLEAEDDCIQSILIRNSFLEKWGVSEHDLLKAAKANTPCLLPPDLEPLTAVLNNIAPGPYSEPEDGLRIYVLTNQTRVQGAATLLYPNVLEQFAGQIGKDFYILPSSIHEVLLVPMDDSITPAELTEMVNDVNRTEVRPDEILSDHIYIYSHQSRAVSA